MGEVRPKEARISAFLTITSALITLAAGMLLLVARALATTIVGGGLLLALAEIFGVTFLMLGLAGFVIAYGILNGRGWSLTAGLTWAIVGVIGGLLALSQGGFGPAVTLVLDGLIVYYLSRPATKMYFGKSP